MKKLGYCVGVLKPDEVIFTSEEPVSLGEFVIIESEEMDGHKVRILGIITSVERLDTFLEKDNYSPDVYESIANIHRSPGIFRAKVSIRGILENDLNLKNLRYPPRPGSQVFRADEITLKEIFSKRNSKSHIKIGTLLGHKDVEVSVDLNQIVSRHLAVLAITGGGKSNAVSVILEEIAKKRGTVVVFDVHGEYENAEYLDDKGRNVVNTIDVRINLKDLTADEIATLCGIDFEKSSRQYFVIQKLVECVSKMRKSGSFITSNDRMEIIEFFDEEEREKIPFIDELIENIEKMIYAKSGRKNEDEEHSYISSPPECRFYETVKKEELQGVYIRLENLKRKLGDRINDRARSVVDQIKPGFINIVVMRSLDYDVMDVIVSHTLHRLLSERKKSVHTGKSLINVPVVVVIEEAHIFAPYGNSTRTKEVLAKVAREARKFGLGVILVSQRPKGLDPDILSQMNNWVILRIVEPEDQKHIQRASETLSGDLLNYLSALNPGEAVLLGPFVNIPLLVQFRKSEAKKAGGDISSVDEWEKWRLMAGY